MKINNPRKDGPVLHKSRRRLHHAGLFHALNACSLEGPGVADLLEQLKHPNSRRKVVIGQVTIRTSLYKAYRLFSSRIATGICVFFIASVTGESGDNVLD